jgi:TetR/AcrR family transcriptional regulator
MAEPDTKEKILQAAKREFAECGFSGARIDAVARRAGVNKALVHYYFNSKEELYRQVRSRFLGIGRRGDMVIVFPAVDLTPSQKLYFTLYYLVKIHLKVRDRDIFRIFFWEIAEGSQLHEEASREHRLPQARLLERIIVEGVESGEFEVSNPRLFVMFMLSFLNMYVVESEFYKGSGLFRELYGDARDDEVLNFFMAMVFRCLYKNAQSNMPSLPVEIIRITDEIIERVVKNIGEGYYATAFQKISEYVAGMPSPKQ